VEAGEFRVEASPIPPLDRTLTYLYLSYRTAQVRYIFNSTASNPVFTFFSEDLSQLNYFFEVESNLIEPRFPSPQAQSIPVVGWVFIGL
jgi:hypothetical protein